MLKFKTNINCNNCIRIVTPFLNKVTGIIKWEVALGNPEKIMTVEGENISADSIIESLQKAGYKGELLI